MSDPLDDVRRALGLPPLVSSPQEAAAGVTAGAPIAPNPFDAAARLHDAMAKQHEAERARLEAAGDDADGLQELRDAFRRMGR